MPGSSVLEDSIEDGTFFPTSQAASATTASVRQSNKGKNKTIEQRYQKKTQIEHILLRPESYIGSVQLDSQSAWVWSKEDSRMIYKQITFAPGLFKIFGENEQSTMTIFFLSWKYSSKSGEAHCHLMVSSGSPRHVQTRFWLTQLTSRPERLKNDGVISLKKWQQSK